MKGFMPVRFLKELMVRLPVISAKAFTRSSTTTTSAFSSGKTSRPEEDPEGEVPVSLKRLIAHIASKAHGCSY